MLLSVAIGAASLLNKWPECGQAKTEGWFEWPCATQLFREKTFESWRPPLVSLSKTLVLVGRGLVSSGEGIARSGQTTRQACQCHFLAGQARTLPSFAHPLPPSSWRV